jgi:hypothetical protein
MRLSAPEAALPHGCFVVRQYDTRGDVVFYKAQDVSVRRDGRCEAVASHDECRAYAIRNANGVMGTTPPEQNFPTGCFVFATKVYYKATSNAGTNRECSPYAQCLCPSGLGRTAWRSCNDGAGGSHSDGVYVITPPGRSPVSVYCDFSTDGGGWTKVLQYGTYYIPSASAIGTIATASTTAAAKLSDTDIVAIAGSSPVWRFVDDGDVAGGDSASRFYMRDTATFSDVLANWGLPRQNHQRCISSALANCGWSSISAITGSRNIDAGANNCNRWFVDHGGTIGCYRTFDAASRQWQPGPAGTRCWTHGNANCLHSGDGHTSRENMGLWVRPSPSPPPPSPSPPPPSQAWACPASVTRTSSNPFGAAATIQTLGYVFGSASGYCSTEAGGLATMVGSARPGVSGIHCFDHLNDGEFGNSNSWIPLQNNAIGGVQFPTPRVVAGIALARDKTGNYRDRYSGTITIELTNVQGQSYTALVGSTDWCAVGAAQTRNGPQSNYYQFSSAVTVAALRIVASDAASCYDELQIFGFAAPPSAPLSSSAATVEATTLGHIAATASTAQHNRQWTLSRAPADNSGARWTLRGAQKARRRARRLQRRSLGPRALKEEENVFIGMLDILGWTSLGDLLHSFDVSPLWMTIWLIAGVCVFASSVWSLVRLWRLVHSRSTSKRTDTASHATACSEHDDAVSKVAEQPSVVPKKRAAAPRWLKPLRAKA